MFRFTLRCLAEVGLWFVLIIAVSAFCRSALAADYAYGFDRYTGPTYPSAKAACDVYLAGITGHGPLDSSRVYWTGYNVEYACSGVFYLDGPDGRTQYQAGTSIFQRGDSCPVGSTYDQASGTCKESQKDGEKCSDQTGSTGPGDPLIYQSSTGTCVLFSKSNDDATCAYIGSLPNNQPLGAGTAYTVKGIWDGGVPTAPPTFTQDTLNCEVATVTSSDCITDVPGNVTCNVTGKFTGKSTSKPQAPNIKDSGCPAAGCQPLEPASTANNNPCVFSGSASSTTCTSEQETQKDGQQNCGTVNGVQKCVFTPPSSNGIKIATVVNTTTADDGSKTAVKTDNATKTVCTGVNKCTTSTSTTTTTTKTNSSGVSTSTSSQCTGTCGSNGTGLGSGGTGTGTGTGSGSGTGEGDGNGDGSGSLTDPENGSFDPQSAEWDQKITKAKTDFKDAMTKMKGAFQPLADTNLAGGAGKLYCPPPVSIPYLNRSLSFCLDDYAGSLSWLSAAIYAVCAVIAVAIIFL